MEDQTFINEKSLERSTQIWSTNAAGWLTHISMSGSVPQMLGHDPPIIQRVVYNMQYDMRG